MEMTDSDGRSSYDALTRYCRSLGHDVPFGYCRSVQQGLPCRRIRDCWFEKLAIDRFLAEHYSREQMTRAFAPPKPKITSILEIVERARRQTRAT